MSEKTKTILSIILGIIGAVLLFCLIVCISCAVNGLTFGEQICSWFGKRPNTFANIAKMLNFIPIK